MKQYFAVLLLDASLLLFACSRGPARTAAGPAAASALRGSWELREVTGGMQPAGSGPDVPPGNGTVWTFTDSTYLRYFRGSPADSGRYRLVQDTSQQTGQLMNAISFPNRSGPLIHFERKGDTLILYNGMIAADGTIEKYVPVENK